MTTTLKYTIGRNHMAPTEYTYCIKINIHDSNSNWLCLFNFEDNTFIGNISSFGGMPYILNGYNKVNNTDIWVINQEKQGYYYLWFKNKVEGIDLCNYVLEKKLSKEVKKINSIYKLTQQGWISQTEFLGRDEIDLIGYSSYLSKIREDIANHKKHLLFLKTIGEGHRTLNYLLSGFPGTGKSSLVKTLATIEKIPIYIVNPSFLKKDVPASVILNPKKQAHETIIILFEDFDRYLKEGIYSMSEIMNELDGIESTEGCIRFFTANDINEINKHDALINRMSSKFVFKYPSIDDFSVKLDRVLTFWDTKWRDNNDYKVKEFLKILDDKNSGSELKITLRPFTNFVIRYLFTEDCLDKMIENIDELV